MLKSILREQDYIEDTKYPKEFPIACLWVGLSILIVAVTYSVVIWTKESYPNIILDFLNDEINYVLKSYEMNSIFYIGLWIFLFIGLAFVVRNKSKSKIKKIILWTILIILIFTAVLLFMLSIAVGFDPDLRNRESGRSRFDNRPFLGFFDKMLNSFAGTNFEIMGIVLVIIFVYLLYCAVKLLVAIIFTRNEEGSVKLRILKGKGLPICYMSEAFKVSQILAIYTIPVIFIYSILLILIMTREIPIWYMLVYFFMTILMSFDLTVVVYAFFCKIVYRMDYIAFDRHLYESNIFTKKK